MANFSGTHSGTVYDATGDVLKLIGAGLFDDIPDLDLVASLDAYGGVTSSGTYTFAGDADLGSVMNVRVTSELETLIVLANDLIDARTEDIDDWVDFDATDGAEADAWVEMRETDDDPAGAPAWGEWERLDASEHECRAMEFRCQLMTEDPAYNIHVIELSVVIDERD